MWWNLIIWLSLPEDKKKLSSDCVLYCSIVQGKCLYCFFHRSYWLLNLTLQLLSSVRFFCKKLLIENTEILTVNRGNYYDTVFCSKITCERYSVTENRSSVIHQQNLFFFPKIYTSNICLEWILGSSFQNLSTFGKWRNGPR